MSYNVDLVWPVVGTMYIARNTVKIVSSKIYNCQFSIAV